MKVLVVCCSGSVASWWPKFCSLELAGSILWPIDDLAIDVQSVLRLVHAHDPATTVVAILSEHETLLRDAALVETLRLDGYEVAGAGIREAQFEWNKLWAKQLFGELQIATPGWSETTSEPGQLFKLNAGTQCKQISWVQSSELPQERGYFETFVRGMEFSAVVFARGHGSAVLPLVWKGETQVDLVPPFQRLRLCGAGLPTAAEIPGLQEAIKRLSTTIAAPCLIEVEFILDARGTYHVIEVNPRIAGTTRLAAMAAEKNIIDPMFESFCDADIHVVKSNNVCAELPVARRGSAAELPGVYATSRLSLKAKSTTAIWQQLLAMESLGWRVEEKARNDLDRAIAAALDNPSAWAIA